MFVRPVKVFDRTLSTAPDKSITHRAVMFNAAAEGEAVVENALLGGDCRSTISCMTRLGARIEVSGGTVRVRGAKRFADAALDAGNSGTTTRLLAGLLAGRGVNASIDGDGSLRSRPMKRVTEPLCAMGADIESTDGRAPLYIRPAKLHGIDYVMPVASAQVKSAVLLAGLGADGETRVTENVPSRDHTELMLKAMGADITKSGSSVIVRRSELRATDVRVPGDISAAAFLFGAAAVVPCGRVTVTEVGLNPTRTGVLDVLCRMGLEVTRDNLKAGAEPYGDVTVARVGALRPFTITAEEVPSLIDEIPLLAAVAAYAEGDSVISGAEELRVKESDRVETTVAMIRAMGGEAEARPDGLVVRGRGGLKGGKVDSFGDHRIAMSAAVAALASRDGCEILGSDSAAISYPGFWEVLC